MEFDKALVKKYDRAGPRYTSYPTAPQFSGAFALDDYLYNAALSNSQADKPLSLYVHVPFCASLCYYCACHKIITQKSERAAKYLTYLTREIELQAALFDGKRKVSQLHLGGGTPTYFTDEQLNELITALTKAFNLEQGEQREFSLEVDPRTVTQERLANLKNLGFNRISFGVQDFNPVVQQAINRMQSFAQTQTLIETARACSFKSISIDLIYGLPLQTIESFRGTLKQVIALRPDRIAAYSYAHLPQQVRAQRLIKAEDMPAPELKLELLELTIQCLTQAGYIYIGMDHFALPDDELSQAQKNGTLQRNFQGYSTHAQCDLIGLGVSSIGKIGSSYSQNAKELSAYYQALDHNRLAIVKGYQLNRDDLIRSQVIMHLMCHGTLGLTAFEAEFGICFNEYFKDELEALKPLAADGLLCITKDQLRLNATGHLLMRNVAMIFDAYLKKTQQRQFSRTV